MQSDIYSLGVLFFELLNPCSDRDRPRILAGLRHRILPSALLQGGPEVLPPRTARQRARAAPTPDAAAALPAGSHVRAGTNSRTCVALSAGKQVLVSVQMRLACNTRGVAAEGVLVCRRLPTCWPCSTQTRLRGPLPRR